MPGPLLHLGATVLCAHGGTATPTAPNPRVLVSGQPTVTMAAPYVIAGCPFNVSGGPVPCVTGQWISGAARVFSHGAPVAITTGASVCSPTGAPLIAVSAHTAVMAS